MSAAGYSKRTLVEKLGIGRAARLSILNAPDGYATTLGKLPQDAVVVGPKESQLDFIQLFERERDGLAREFPGSVARLKADGMIWVCWPKRHSKIKTDLTDSVVREIGLGNGLVDVKVCAIDGSWSGLKFVRRLRDRRVSSLDA
jgi:hypothetical protein